MAPKFTDEDLVQYMNNVFSTDKPIDINIDKIRRPSSDFAKNIYLAVLTESGYDLNGDMLNLDPNLTSLHTHSIVNEHFPAVLIMTAARKFFNTLAEATGDATDTAFVFGLNDLLAPEPRRLKFFLSHFINYWLFCNNNYEEFESTVQQVEKKARQRGQLENIINDYKKKNADLNKSKATSAMKKDKMVKKIEQGQEFIGQLTNNINEMNEHGKMTKQELLEAQELEHERKENEGFLTKTALRLKSMAKADETKQELNAKLERLEQDEEAKIIQVQECKSRRDRLAEQEMSWKEVLHNLNDLSGVMENVKSALIAQKSSIADGEAAHEHLETIENKCIEIQRIIDTLKGEVTASKAKWDKRKAMKEDDFKEYSDKLDSIQQQMTEDDMVSNELVDRYVNGLTFFYPCAITYIPVNSSHFSK